MFKIRISLRWTFIVLILLAIPAGLVSHPIRAERRYRQRQANMISWLEQQSRVAFSKRVEEDDGEVSESESMEFERHNYVSVGDGVDNIRPLYGLTAMRFVSADIRDGNLAPLRKCDKLEGVEFTGSPINDLSPLKECRRMELLYLGHTRVNDISVLHGMRKLKEVDLGDTPIDDLTPMAPLAHIERLSIERTKVDDIRPIEGSQRMEWLSLKGSRVNDISAVATMPSLTTLNIHDTPVNDLGPLRYAPTLKELFAGNTRVVDLRPLRRGTPGLSKLYLHDTKVHDLTPLSRLKNLKVLTLNRTDVRDLKPLSGLKHLEQLMARGTLIQDLTPLSRMKTPLFRLDLSECPITTVEPLANCMNLTDVDISYTHVSDLTPLTTIPLNRLNLSFTGITDISGLPSFQFLYELGLAGLINIREVEIWHNLPQTIRRLDLSQTNITGRALRYLPKRLTKLNVSGTQVAGEHFKLIRRYKQLEFLDVSRTKLSPANVSWLLALKHLWQLEMNGKHFGDAHLQQLHGVRLYRLSLQGTSITDQGVKSMGRMSSELDLSHTAITDKGLKAIIRNGCPFKLHLRGTRITDEGIKALIGQDFSYLDVRDTAVTPEGLAVLKRLTRSYVRINEPELEHSHRERGGESFSPMYIHGKLLGRGRRFGS